MRVELTKQEYKWLADLVNRAKTEAAQANEETPHPLYELRCDNMAALEGKISAAIHRQIERDGRNAR